MNRGFVFIIFILAMYLAMILLLTFAGSFQKVNTMEALFYDSYSVTLKINNVTDGIHRLSLPVNETEKKQLKLDDDFHREMLLQLRIEALKYSMLDLLNEIVNSTNQLTSLFKIWMLMLFITNLVFMGQIVYSQFFISLTPKDDNPSKEDYPPNYKDAMKTLQNNKI